MRDDLIVHLGQLPHKPFIYNQVRGMRGMQKNKKTIQGGLKTADMAGGSGQT
jgi:hypothetical protein